MATPRQTRTPGAKTAPTEALPESEDTTSAASEPVQKENQSEQQTAPDYKDLQAQIDQLKQQLGHVAEVKRTRDVIGPHGWTKEEI